MNDDSDDLDTALDFEDVGVVAEPETYTAEEYAAALVAEREKVSAEAKAAAQAEFDERRSHFDRRDQKVRETLAKSGLALTDEGPAVTDLTKVLSLLGMGAAKQAEPKADEADVDWYDPAQRAAYIAKEAQRIAAQEVKGLRDEFISTLGPLVSAQNSLIAPRAEEAIKSYFDREGLSGLQSHASFKEAFEPLFDKLPPDAKGDRKQVQAVAAYAAALVSDEDLADVRQKAAAAKQKADAQAERDRMRGGLPGTLGTNTQAPQTHLVDQSDIDRELLEDLPEYRDQILKFNKQAAKERAAAGSNGRR